MKKFLLVLLTAALVLSFTLGCAGAVYAAGSDPGAAVPGRVNTPVYVSKTTGSLTFSWDEYTASPIDGYVIYEYDKAAGVNTEIASVGSETVKYTVKGLEPGTAHRYRVAAYVNDTAGNRLVGPKSSYLYMTTKKKSLSNAAVELSYTAVQYSGSAKKPKVVSVVLTDGTTAGADKYSVQYSDNVAAGTATVTLTADDPGYSGSVSREFVILGKAATPVAVSKTTESLTFSWDKYTKSSIDGYIIYEFNKASGVNTKIATVGSGTLKYTAKGLKPGTSHRYRVAAYKKNTDGEKAIGSKSSYLYMTTKKKSLKNAVISLSYTVTKYDGTARRPKVKSVKLSDGSLVPSSAYKVSYSDNTGVGTGKVTVKPASGSGYMDSRSASFYIIGKMSAPKAVERGKTYIVLGWDKHPGTKIDGYKIYKRNSEGSYVVVKTVAGAKTTTCRIKNLSSKKAYRFKIAAYKKDSVTGKTVKGSKSSYKKLYTLPPTPSKEVTSLSLNKPYIKVKWRSKSTRYASSFEIRYATNSSFSGYSKVSVKNNGEVNTYNLKNLADGVRYYVKVRAVNTYGGYTAYGGWSDTKSLVAESDGWATVNGRKYYYRNGTPLKGSQIISGEHYYFDSVTGECHGVTADIWSRVKNVQNDNKYLVSICISRHRINIFEKKGGDWVMIKQWSCTTGLNDQVTPANQYTPRGSYQIRYKVKTFGDTYSVWYATNFTGPFYIHSILYNHGSMTSVQDGRLGISASHGCIRTALVNAKWVYDNVSKGSALISSMY